MGLIDYSKKKADATPTGSSTVGIPRRHASDYSKSSSLGSLKVGVPTHNSNQCHGTINSHSARTELISGGRISSRKLLKIPPISDPPHSTTVGEGSNHSQSVKSHPDPSQQLTVNYALCGLVDMLESPSIWPPAASAMSGSDTSNSWQGDAVVTIPSNGNRRKDQDSAPAIPGNTHSPTMMLPKQPMISSDHSPPLQPIRSRTNQKRPSLILDLADWISTMGDASESNLSLGGSGRHQERRLSKKERNSLAAISAIAGLPPSSSGGNQGSSDDDDGQQHQGKSKSFSSNSHPQLEARNERSATSGPVNDASSSTRTDDLDSSHANSVFSKHTGAARTRNQSSLSEDGSERRDSYEMPLLMKIDDTPPNEGEKNHEMPSLLPTKPLIETSRRNRPRARNGAMMDDAMPSMFAGKKSARPHPKPNPFARCNTSNLVKEHRSRRPTVLVEVDGAEDMDVSANTCNSDSDLPSPTEKVDSQKKSNQDRTSGNPREERDWSKPSIQTVDWTKPSNKIEDTAPRPGVTRSASENLSKSSKNQHDPESNQGGSSRDRRSMMVTSLSMSNVFFKKPALKRAVSFSMRRRRSEATTADGPAEDGSVPDAPTSWSRLVATQPAPLPFEIVAAGVGSARDSTARSILMGRAKLTRSTSAGESAADAVGTSGTDGGGLQSPQGSNHDRSEKPARKGPLSFGFGVPDAKFGYEQRKEEAARLERGRRKPMKRATSMSFAQMRDASDDGPTPMDENRLSSPNGPDDNYSEKTSAVESFTQLAAPKRRGGLGRSMSLSYVMNSFTGVKRNPPFLLPNQEEFGLGSGLEESNASIIQKIVPAPPTLADTSITLTTASLKGSGLPPCDGKPENLTCNQEPASVDLGYGDSETDSDLGYGETQPENGNNNDMEYDESLCDENSTPGLNDRGRERSRRQRRSSSMNHMKMDYSDQSRSRDDDSDGDKRGRHQRRRSNSLNNLSTTLHHQGKLSKVKRYRSDDMSSSHHGQRSRPSGTRQPRRMASMSHGLSREFSHRREIDSSCFVTGSRIRRIDKGSQLGLAR